MLTVAAIACLQHAVRERLPQASQISTKLLGHKQRNAQVEKAINR
ncbi:hypothetical protein [Nostoc sp.]